MSSPKLAAAAKPDDDMLAPLRNAPADRPFVVAQLGQSLDGRIATLSGESRWINHECALDHLHALRAHVDAVVVGVGTVLADDPRLNVRRVPGRSPARVVIDPSGKLPANAVCVKGDDVARYVVRTEQAPCPAGVETIVVPRTAEHLSPQAIVEALFARGLKRLLIEGGAWTVSSFIAARRRRPAASAGGAGHPRVGQERPVAAAHRPARRCVAAGHARAYPGRRGRTLRLRSA